MDDDASSSPASYIRLVQHLIEKCICYKLNKEECMETLEKHAKIMPVITSTVWKELEKENREFFETYRKDRGGGPNPNPNQEEAAAAGHHHPPSRVQQSCCSQQEWTTTTTLQKNPSACELEHRVVVAEKDNREFFPTYKKDLRGEESSTLLRKNPSDDEQEQRVVEKENRKNNPSASNSKSSHGN